ncbi:MAG: hypothetical protein L0Y72_22105 [Gemmataceae bacterium]|nr:hypothetical protein [Gemmataceae bacterium]MCI0741736.1 hypothetical protein [Gemmataceae bacterium]
MKVDKEVLLKHKFWVALGVTVPLALVALFVLLTAVSADIDSRRKQLKDQHDQFKSITDPATPAIIEEERVKADDEKVKETVVHRKAYAAQAGLFRWPEAIENEFDFQNGYFAYDIKAVRKKDPDPAGVDPPKNEDRLVHGVIVDVRKDFILVKGYDNKDYKFRRIPRPKISISGDETKDNQDFRELMPKDKVTVLYDDGKYFNDALTDSEQGVYVSPGVYHNQIKSILEQVEPMNGKGEGVVQLRGWFYELDREGKVILPMSRMPFLNFLPGNGWEHIDLDISQEAWIAQEDLWIQKEIYRLVRLANDYVSRFESKHGGKGPEDKSTFHTFSNPYLELKLQWPGGNVLNVKLKNLQNRRQKLDLNLRVHFHKDKLNPEIVPIGGEPLNPAGIEGSEITKQIKLSDNALRTGIYSVEQVLTWETAAVKRIDQICIGTMGDISHSHRTFPLGVQTLVKEDIPADAGNDPKAQAGLPPGGAPLMPKLGVVGGPGGGLPGMGVGMGQGNALTKHGFVKDRYLEVTPQARRLPVAVSLIVEQEHVDRVQTAFNNSVLRFLTTQVLVNRYPSSMRPHLVGQGSSGYLDPGGIGEGGLRMPAGLMPPQMPGAFGGFPGGDVAGGVQPGGFPASGQFNPFGITTTAADDMETNVEVVLYGIVTLYERFPPSNRPKETKAP